MFTCDMVLYYLRVYFTLGKSPTEMIDPNHPFGLQQNDDTAPAGLAGRPPRGRITYNHRTRATYQPPDQHLPGLGSRL
jgi:hypothetical protein